MRWRALMSIGVVAVFAACGTDSGDGGEGPDAGSGGGGTSDAAGGGGDASGGAGGGGDGDLYDQLDPELQDLFDELNAERASRGIDPVSLREDLLCAGQRHADDVGPKELCQHEGTDGSEFFDRIADCGGRAGASGETIACGAQTPRGAVDSWLGSTGHREIMLDGRYSSVGIAEVNNYWVAVWAN